MKQYEFRLVRKVGLERAVIHSLAPYLVVPEKMILPITKRSEFGLFATSLGLWIYDKLANVKGSDKRRMLSREGTLNEEPLFLNKDVIGSGFYSEYRTDDSRLTIEVLKMAVLYGAVCVNYLEAKSFNVQNGKITGTFCTDTAYSSSEGESFEIRALKTINATGPWVDIVRRCQGDSDKKKLILSKGSHIAIAHHKLPLRHSIYFQLPDNRMIFCIPRHRTTYIGTTDTAYNGQPGEEYCNRNDAEYLLSGANYMFPQCRLGLNDIESSWAGLRPLISEEGKELGEISRKDEIFISPNGLISIAGGKLTGYRLMAEKVCNIIAKQLKAEYKKETKNCNTKSIKIQEVNGRYEATLISLAEKTKPYFSEFDISKASYLLEVYGMNAFSIVEELPTESESMALELMRSELRFCLNHEMVVHAIDFFKRRTGKIFFDIHQVIEDMDTILEDMKEFFKWSENQMLYEKQLVENALQKATAFNS